MNKTDIKLKLEELQRQVEQLAADATSRTAEATPSATNPQPAHDERAAGEEADLSLLRAKLDDFLELLNQDLQQIPTTTAVGIFALGVLTGRLLPR